MQQSKAALKIVTRAKGFDDDAHFEQRVVVLNRNLLEAYFTFPLNEAADLLGISMTALKR